MSGIGPAGRYRRHGTGGNIFDRSGPPAFSAPVAPDACLRSPLVTTSRLRRTLRSEGRRARVEISDDDRVHAELRLIGHLRTLSPETLAGARSVVGGYVADDGEPDIGPWLEQLRSRHVEVALPVPTGPERDASMHFRRWQDGETLEPGRYGIPCPPDRPGRAVVPDVVIVPLVRFDPSGNRLGRGAGYYDRWLAGNPCVAIGVAFEAQRVGEVPTRDHDVALDIVVTELGVRFPGRNRGDCRVPMPDVDKDGMRCE